MKSLLLPAWVIAGICLLLYSFTQVDLSLTFSQAGIYQTIEKYFQYVGWFNRPLSAGLYLLIIGIMFGLYSLTLNLVRTKKLEEKTVWKFVICISVILFFSYNAFSYDLFNYIFDAKILVHYHQNPYFHKALDFPGDPMLSFMRWTHRTYPYGPAWLVITVPISFLGMGIFSVTFYLFKLLMAASFIGSAYFVGKIAKKLDFNPALSIAAFALNPLVLIESLVSAHNDIVMIFLGLLGLWLFLEKKYFTSVISFTTSILIKFVTVLLIPVILIKQVFKISNEKFALILIAAMLAGVIAATLRTNFQPWYLLYVLPFTAFLQKKYYTAIPVVLISIAGLLQYVPYLYLGNWDPPVPLVLNCIMIVSVILSILFISVKIFTERKSISN